VHDVQFDVALFTNLTRDHLDYHGTMEAYYLAKRQLFQGRPAEGKRRAAVINIDDAFGDRLHRETSIEVQLTYGASEKAVLRVTEMGLGPESTRLVVETPRGRIKCEMNLIGRHNVYNALAALGAGLALDIPLGKMIRALESMPAVPGRLEAITRGQPFGVFVDYAHTDDALRNVLSTLRELTRGRLLVVFGCGGNRDAGKRPAMGRVAAELADFSMITSDNPRKESPAAIAAQVVAGHREARPDGYRVELDRGRAIDEVLRMARAGDIVLIAGKGHETYQEFEDTVVPFDDRVCASETLETLGYEVPA
jgi:UDP-N-acetylmuramoyl-L-alanyl-D-glutamate--2,6-diaminopimelate ligase